MEKQVSILVIEDDPSICQVIQTHLQREGFAVVTTADGGDGLERALSGQFGLVLLDLQLEGIGGIDVCKRIRKQNEALPIIMLTSRAEEIDKVIGLEVGADDYITKPFSVYELTARIRARLRVKASPTSQREKNESQILVFGNLSIDLDRRRVLRSDVPIELTATEFDVLAFLAQCPGLPCSRELLLEEVWNLDAPGYIDTVTALIQRLRQKIEPDSANPIYILTVRGVGYRFVEQGELDAGLSPNDN